MDTPQSIDLWADPRLSNLPPAWLPKEIKEDRPDQNMTEEEVRWLDKQWTMGNEK